MATCSLAEVTSTTSSPICKLARELLRLAAYDLVRRECRASAAEIIARDASAAAKRQAANVASAKAVAAVERLTRSDRRLAATVSQWDSEREVFTTPGEPNDD